MLCPADSFTYTFDLVEDLLACCGPDEASCFRIVGFDEDLDLGDEILRADKGSAPDLALGYESEPAFDLIEPRRISRREMQVEAGSFREPGPDLGVLVRRVVVDHQVEIEIARDIGFDVLQEAQELLMSVAGAALRDDLTVGDIESGEQRRCSMPIVVVGHSFDVAEPQRQDRLAPFKRLDLRLFVDAENEGVIWWIQVQTNNVPDLVNELRIGRQLEMSGAVRLYAEQSEGSRDRAFRKAGRCGGGAHGPVRRVGGLAVEDGAQKLRHSLFVVGSRAPGPRLAVQADKALIEPFLAPVANGRVRDSQSSGYAEIGLA